MVMKLADYLIENPIYAAGQRVGAAGTQTTPVLSPMEGLARALQGGIGGMMVGYGMHQAGEERKADSEALASALDAYGKGDAAKAQKILADRPNLAEQSAAIGMQNAQMQNKIALARGVGEGLFGPGTMTPNAAPPGGGAMPVSPQALEPHFQTAAQATGLPVDLLKRVAATESAFNPNAVSPAGAGGVMQLMPGTAQGLGVQNVRDPAANIMGGAQYLQQQIGKYGNLQHALAAYNWGPANVDAWLKAGGDPSRLPAETQGYISKVMGGGQPQQQAYNAPAGNLPPGFENFRGAPADSRLLDAAKRAFQAGDEATGRAYFLKAIEAGSSFSANPQVERVTDQNGNQIIVPKYAAIGMTSYEKQPNPGDKQGDVALLTQAMKNPAMLQDPAVLATVKAAYDRQAQPQMSQSGQLQYPDMSAWNALGFAAPQTAFRDTPSSQFTMSNTLQKEYGDSKTVKDYREVAPILQSMKEAAGRNDRVADLNLIYGLAKIMDPGSVVREGEMTMVKNTQSLPDWVRTALTSAVNGTSNFTPEQRQRIIREAESRMGALQGQYDTITKSYRDKAQRYGLNPEDVTGTLPQSAQPQQAAPQTAVPVYDINGKRIK